MSGDDFVAFLQEADLIVERKESHNSNVREVTLVMRVADEAEESEKVNSKP